MTGTHDLSLSPDYDGLGRATRLPWSHNGADHAAFDLAYDAMNNLTSRGFDHLAGDPAESYVYDTLDRLTRVDYGQKSGDPYESFALDDLGSRTSHDDNSSGGGAVVGGLFNAVNELTKLGADALGYSKTGNLTRGAATGGGYAYLYNRGNQLTRVEDSGSGAVGSMAYDALGRRIELVDHKANGGSGKTTRFYHDGSRVIEDTDASGSAGVQRHYVWGNYVDELLLMRDVAGVGGTPGSDYVVARDQRYSPVALVKRSDGSVVERYDYRALGQTEFQDASGR